MSAFGGRLERFCNVTRFVLSNTTITRHGSPGRRFTADAPMSTRPSVALWFWADYFRPSEERLTARAATARELEEV